MTRTYHAGDILVRSKGPLSDHYGIYLGPNLVAENNGHKQVQLVSMTDFLNGKKIIGVAAFDGSEEDRLLIPEKINQLVGTRYDLVRFNCEHFDSVDTHEETPKPMRVRKRFNRRKQSQFGNGLLHVLSSVLGIF